MSSRNYRISSSASIQCMVGTEIKPPQLSRVPSRADILLQSLQESIVEFSNETTIHGVKELLGPVYSLRSRIMWIIVLALACLGVVYEAQKIIQEYSTEPVATRQVFQVPTRFPNVTVCPRYWFDTEKLDAANLDNKDVLRYLMSFFHGIADEKTMNFMHYNLTLLLNNRFHIPVDYKRFSKDIDRLQGTFEKALQQTSESTDQPAENETAQIREPLEYGGVNFADLVRRISTTPYIAAYTSGSNSTTVFQFMMDAMCYTIVPTDVIHPFEILSKELIIISLERNPKYRPWRTFTRLFIGETALGPQQTSAINLKPASNSIILVQVSHYSRVASKDRPCRLWSTTLRKQAFFHCLNTAVCQPVAGCSLFWEGTHENTSTLCSLLRPREHCFWKNATAYRIAYEHCHETTPAPCQGSTYQPTILNQAHPAFQNTLQYSVFTLRYLDPYNTVITVEYFTYTVETFLCNLGGIVSLFCGASVLSIFQIIMFCISREPKRKVDADAKIGEKGKDELYFVKV